MKKSNLLGYRQNKNIKVGKRIKFTLDLKNENSKKNEKPILNSISKEKSENENEKEKAKENSIEKVKENENENNILEDKDYLAEFKEKNKSPKNEEKNNESNDEIKLYENEEEDEYLNQPLMKVHRMSMKKKELAKIRNNLKKSNMKNPESINNVTIDRNRAQKMAQNFFKTRLKYFNQIRMNSESKDKNISDYVSSKPKRHFKNILSNNSDINNDFSEDKNNNNKININTNKYNFEDENENEKHNINLKKKFRRLPTDIYKNNYDSYLIQNNLNKNEENKENKEKHKNNDKIMIKEKEIKKEKLEDKKGEIKVISIKEIKEIPKKENKEEPKKIKKEEQIKLQKEEIKQQIPINKREYRRKYNLSNISQTNNYVHKRNNWSYSFNKEANKTTSSLINSTQQNIKPKNIGGIRIRLLPLESLQKELNQETEKNEEKENLSSFRYRRKYKQKENKTEKEEPKLVYKAVIRVNKRIFQNNVNTKKEPIENKYKKFKEIKVGNNYNTEENIRNRYEKKINQNNDEVNKKNEKEKIKKLNDNKKDYKTSTAFYRRRGFKNL